VSVSTGQPEDVGASNGQGPQEAPPGQSDGTPRPSVVDVSVGNVEAGDDLSLDVSPASVEADAVAFDEVSITAKRGGDFSMRVINSQDPLPGSPDFVPGDAAEALGHIRLEHTITNEQVEDVSYQFRVSKARLRSTGTDPEEVALYRFSKGDWTALPTDVVGESTTHYVFEAQSPGMSEFAVGAERPAFDTYWADVNANSVDVGDGVSVSGRISNVGSADGVYQASLRVDGEVVSTRTVTIAAGGTRQVNFETSFDSAGPHEVAIDGVQAGEVTVEAQPEGTDAASLDQAIAVGFEWVLNVGRSLDSAGLSSAVGL